MTPPKEYSDFPGTNSKEMELQEFPDKEFKIIALRKLCELQEYPSVQLHEIRKTIREQKDQQRDRNHKKKFKQKFWKGRIQGMKLQMQYRTSMADLTKKKK